MMITTLPRVRDAKILPRLASDRRKKISQVGKVFPKKIVEEKVDEKLDFHCVGLENDKNVSFPTVGTEVAPNSPHRTEEEAPSPALEPGDGNEITLPQLPSILGNRRGGAAPSPDASEPLDLLIKGEAHKKSDTEDSLEGFEEPPVIGAEEVMRSNLEPLIDTLFEEDELFAQDFEEDGLHRILFIRKMGIYVEMKTKDYLPGILCTPLFHCPPCKDHWMEFGTTPEHCPFPRQPTRGPAIHLASNRKPRFGGRKRKAKRRLGDIKEGFMVSGSGTVLNQLDENGSEDFFLHSEFHENPSNRSGAPSSIANIGSRDYLTSDDVKLDGVNLRKIDSTTIIEAFKEGGGTQKLDKETYVRTLATAVGFEPSTLMEAFRKAAVAEKLEKEKYFETIAAALGVDLTIVLEAFKKVADVEKLDNESYIRHLATELGVDSTTIMEAFKKVADKQKLNIATCVKTVETALGFDEERYNDFTRVNINNALNTDDARFDGLVTTLGSTTSNSNIKAFVKMTLNSSVLSSLRVKDLPEWVGAKLLSLLRLQRKRNQKLALSKRNRVTGTGSLRGTENMDSRESSGNKELNSEDFEAADAMRGITEVSAVKTRLTSASGRRHSFMSDDEGFSASRSPSDVLAYKEIQSQRRSKKKNRSVRNRSGQPDTPHQKLGRHSTTVPSNSSSIYSVDDGDSDDENWGRIRAPRVGSSRAHLSDSRLSYMSEMSRTPHATDSRTAILRNYSRTMGSARGQRNVSFSNLDDQLSYGSLGNDDSMLNLIDEATGTMSNRARRSVRKPKEKGDNVKRPGIYHSKVIQDMNLGQRSQSTSHVTTSFGDINVMHGSNARLSQGKISRLSLADASSALSFDSKVVDKRSSRPASGVTGKECAQRQKETPEPESVRLDFDDSTLLKIFSESIDELPPLPIAAEAAIPEDSVALSPAQAQQGENPKKLFQRIERKKPLVVLQDLNVIHRLPVSSAFTYSFYELPSQHRKENESIKKAADRIGRRKKRESGQFRSRSAP